MNFLTPTKMLATCVTVATLLSACGGGGGGGSGGAVPGTPIINTVSIGPATGTSATVAFVAPGSYGSSAITSYTVTANPGGISASGTASPITLTGLTPKTAYTYSVVANNSQGSSAAASSGQINFYSVVETFNEPMTQPNNTIFTGTFTFDATNKRVSNLKGALTQSMTKPNPACVSAGMGAMGGMGTSCYGAPMTTVALNYPSSNRTYFPTWGGQLVTTFALMTTDTFNGGGYAPGGTEYFGLSTNTPNNNNAYAMVYINTTDPTTPLTQAQIDKLAYADCTPGGMMGATCMTGTTVAGYGRLGTMNGTPVSQVITKL